MPNEKVFKITTRPYVKVKGDDRHTLDTYLTPVGLVRMIVNDALDDLLDRVDRKEFTDEYPLVVYDFGAGVGVFGAVARDELQKRQIPCKIVGFEINPAYEHQWGYNEWKVCDVTELDPSLYDTAHLIFMNPPFILAEEFILKAESMLIPRVGRTWAMLPVDFFFSTNKREEFFQKHAPRSFYFLSRRPSFYHLLTESTSTENKHYAVVIFDTIERNFDFRRKFEYDTEDPIHVLLQESKSMAVYQLIYEASKAKPGDYCWDDLYSLMAARIYGTMFIAATDDERAGLRAAVEKQLREKSNGK